MYCWLLFYNKLHIKAQGNNKCIEVECRRRPSD